MTYKISALELQLAFPRIHFCEECASDWSWRVMVRRGMLVVAFLLTCMAFGQTAGEDAIRIADLERRVQPLDSLTISVAELKTEVRGINDKIDTQTTQSRELLAGFILLISTKIMDAFGFTIRRNSKRNDPPE